MEEIKEEVVVEEVVAEEPKPKKKRAAKKKDESFKLDLSKYYETVKFQSEDGRIGDKEMAKAEFQGKSPAAILNRCKLRAAKAYEVNIDHLEKAYYELNGKKIDGFFADMLLDRHGFSTGLQISRKTFLERLKSDAAIASVDVAEAKLKAIINNSDIKAAYAKYVKEGLQELQIRS